MKRHTSWHLHRDEKPKPSRNEDIDTVLRASMEEEKRRRRREWMIEQEKIDRHNRLKRKMAIEYEIRRARNMGLALLKRRCNRPRRSKSLPSPHRRTSEHYTPKVTILSKKFGTLSGTTSLFKGPGDRKISRTELRKTKVDIHRNIPGRPSTHELKRDIPNKEDVLLKRRAGEGSKPIFDRDEIKRALSETEAVVEHRIVVTVNLENSENKSKTLKMRSTSLSLTRIRDHNPRRTSSPHPRYDDFEHDDIRNYRSDREKDHSRERKDGDKSYRDHRERSGDHSQDRRITDKYRGSPRERRDGDGPREQRVSPQHYIEQIPVSIYYRNFQPRPLMVGPWMPIRGPLGGNVHPPMMRPLRTFTPRLIGISPDLYGFRPLLNPRFPPMF